MSSGKDIAINKANALIELLKTNGIDINEAYVFGSATKDMADEYSDIDIAIVSKDFCGMPYYDVKKVSKYRRAIDLRLEIHPFSLKDINVDPPLFFMKIKNNNLVKSLDIVMPDLIRHPEVVEFTGFRLSPE